VTQLPTTLAASLKRNLSAGFASLVVLFGGVGVWATTAELSSAVIATGTVVVEGYSKKVQHPTGGVVAELLVEEGQIVPAGDVIVRLDSTIIQANRSAIAVALNQLYARRQRLSAEGNGAIAVNTAPELLQRLSPKDAETAMQSERRLFESRRLARDGQKARLHEQEAQLVQQILGFKEQEDAKTDEIELIEKELQGTRRLFDLGAIPLNRVNNLDRGVARLRGERGQLIASIASTKARISEIELQLLQIDQQMRAEAAAEQRDVENKLSDLAEQEVKALDELSRTDIRAPISGAVHALAVHTIGGVVKPAEVLMEIVPESPKLSIEAQIAPQNIDQLNIGQEATIRMAAFNRNTTPELTGTINRISADLETDERSRTSFYRVSLSVPPKELNRLSDLKLLPGMPAEIFISTGMRTPASYFFKPIHDHTQRVFREE
jgi:HlyD family secretion protein